MPNNFKESEEYLDLVELMYEVLEEIHEEGESYFNVNGISFDIEVNPMPGMYDHLVLDGDATVCYRIDNEDDESELIRKIFNEAYPTLAVL